jgi:hypothetical protein
VTETHPDESGAQRYVAFADEAQHNVGRVRGVAVVSLRAADADRLAGEVATLIASSGVTECKWELVRSARQSFAAAKLLAWALERALGGRIWIDVLTWSTEDAAAWRQALPSLARLRQMYAHLLDLVIRDRPPAKLALPDAGALPDRHTAPNGLQAAPIVPRPFMAENAPSTVPQPSTAGDVAHGCEPRWSIYPDEQQALDWTKIAARMASCAQIERIEPQRSHEAPLIQVADLFVGLGVFSRDSYDAYQRWRSFPDDERNVPGGRFVTSEPAPASMRYRCALLDDFYTTCVRRLPGISLHTRCGLHTVAPRVPIRFRRAAEPSATSRTS